MDLGTARSAQQHSMPSLTVNISTLQLCLVPRRRQTPERNGMEAK